MFTILKYIFWIALAFIIVYVLFLVYKNIKSDINLNSTSNNISNFLNNFNLESPKDLISKSTAENFFTPVFVAPLTVVPGPGWYENMDTLYRQIYLNNMNAIQANSYLDQFTNIENLNQYKSTSTEEEPRLQLLFPSSWIMNLKY